MRLVALAIALFLVPQDQKVTLKFAPQKGDKISKVEKMEMKLTCTVDAGGQAQEMEFQQRGSDKSVTEYVDVADGKVVRKSVDHQESYQDAKQPPTMEWARTDNPLHGKKVTVFMKDGRLVREGAEGIEEDKLKSLTLDERDSFLFPKNPIAIGESWEIKGDDLLKFLQGDNEIKDGKVTVKLVEVKEIDKRKCAVLKGAFELKGKTENDMDLGVKLDADLVIWIDRGYMLSMKGKGTVTVKGGNDQFSMTGGGPMTVDIERKIN